MLYSFNQNSLFLEVLGVSEKSGPNKKTSGAIYYCSYTKENVANSVTVLNSMSKMLPAGTFQIQCSTLVNNCHGKHTKSFGCPRIEYLLMK